jgi:uncharacterized protein YheU (UPF0270 family)
MTPKEILRDAFSTMSRRQKQNVRYHLKRGTRVIAWNEAAKFADVNAG